MIAAQVLPDLANRPVLAALELAPDQPWPPAGLPANVFDAGNLDTREQRSALLDALARSAASRLLIACDARQTPDRGTLALLAELSDKAAQTRVWLLQAGAAGAGQGRGSLWQARLLDAGLPEAAILRDADHPLRWLEAAHD
ncbi:membrane protein [Bordetella pertussis]|nr:membrane protein [Bordetella pertussis]CFV98446.1 membrane protein [Bordetella pertussis]CPI62383.1 membrane protein [Bordetella pertussis]CPL86624.1 membrane protein [Bordetella pertussis]CPN02533.1 membrane protein [Bordetella pertussis]